ncbi:MAG: penicillin-binding transpeptidase domain-containing protein [Anaerovoracaceae bacterium]
MKKLEKRAIICLTLAFILFAGIGFFTFKFVTHGGNWATFYANDHIYEEGILSVGKIFDRNGNLLAENKDGDVFYSDSETIRRATVHVVGDKHGNIASSAESAFKDRLVGYSLLTGTYSLTGRGKEIHLAIDQDACETAYNALGGRNGTIGVYNYETGEILCLVSSPGFDPANPPELTADDTSGIYINKFLSSTLIPGSIFKLVTTAAAIDTLPDLDNWTYQCTGSKEISGEKITCPSVHGTVDLYGALAQSCNCAYATLTLRVGAEVMEEYVDKLGLTKSYNVNGIETAKGKFVFPRDARLNLGWSGIGQYEDELNPCSMMTYMGAIAGGGKGAVPRLIKPKLPIKKYTDEMISEETASKVADMMKNNVKANYGEGNFPGLDIYAKSGTAEVGGYKEPNAWFVGFIKNPDHPYAFVVCVENGGYGSSVSGPIANTVLQSMVD